MRLIDADELLLRLKQPTKEEIKKVLREEYDNAPNDEVAAEAILNMYETVREAIKNAPTIESPRPGWKPCAETTSDPTTGEIVSALRNCPNCGDCLRKDQKCYGNDEEAADRLESQERAIAELTARAESAERERDALETVISEHKLYCFVCKHEQDDVEAAPCNRCWNGKEFANFERRGLQPQDGGGKLMGKFRKKPVVIDAWQFTKKNYKNGAPDFIRNKYGVVLWSQYGGDVIGGEIQTLEGKMTVSENDFIIMGVNGEFYPCKPDIFDKTYEPVEQDGGAE